MPNGVSTLIAEARRIHAELVEPVIGRPLGLGETVLAALERRLGLRLPAAYREYLAWMGLDVDGVFRGCRWFAADVFANKNVLRELLVEQGSAFELVDTHVVFFTHQGYMAAWFDAASTQVDPDCWFFSDSLTEPRPEGRFSQVLTRDLEGLARGLHASGA